MEFINALLIEPGKRPRLVLIENSYICISGVIGDKVAGIQPWSDNMIALFCPNGATNHWDPNRVIIDDKLRPAKQVFGSLLLCAVESKGERLADYVFCSMDADQFRKYRFRFAVPDVITRDPNTGILKWRIFYQNFTETDCQ